MIARAFVSVLFLTLVRNAVGERCEALDGAKVHPYSCCKYPLFKFEQSDVKNCQQDTCAGKAEAELMACMNKCVIGDMYVNGAVNTKKIESLFSDSLTERVLSEDSLALLEASVEKVGTDIPKELESNPMFPAIFLMHVMGLNFVNCQKFDEKEECEELRNAVEDCAGKNEIENFMDGLMPPK